MRRNGTVSWFGSMAGELLLILFVVALVPQVWQAEARRLRAQSRFEDMDEVELTERDIRRSRRSDPVPSWQWERLEPADLDATGEYSRELQLPPVHLEEELPVAPDQDEPPRLDHGGQELPSLRERPPRIPMEGFPSRTDLSRTLNRVSPERLPRNRLPR